jgi:putative two-component system response regulator
MLNPENLLLPREKGLSGAAERRHVRALIVDDHAMVRGVLIHLLQRRGIQCIAAEGASEALKLLGEREFELMLCDVNMPPGKSGLALIEDTCRRFPDLATIMVTGEDNPQLADQAIAIGAYGYVLKPFQANQLMFAVSSALRRRQLEMENRGYRESLEFTVLERTRDLRTALEKLQIADQALRDAHEEVVNRLMRAAEFRDNETAQHIRRISYYCELLAQMAGQNEAWCDQIKLASPMHDIGKIGTPDQILLKPGRLDPDELKIMYEHAEIGYRILSGSGAPILDFGASIAYTHHEKYDGSGYPNGLAGEAIPLEGRITAIADVFDALLSRRVYKSPYALEDVLEMMREQEGKHFDPSLLGLFLGNMDGALAIKARFPDG